MNNDRTNDERTVDALRALAEQWMAIRQRVWIADCGAQIHALSYHLSDAGQSEIIPGQETTATVVDGPGVNLDDYYRPPRADSVG